MITTDATAQATTHARAARRTPVAEAGSGSFETLAAIERQVLWLSTAIVDHANRVRPNPMGRRHNTPVTTLG